MQRLARGLLPLVSAAAVLGLGAVHASWIGRYGFASTSRFSWSLAYAAVLSLAAYAVGLPDLPRNAYAALGAASFAGLAGALAVSTAQLALGSQLLPRFVVFWSAAFVIPLYGLCAFVSARGRRRRRRRDRVLAVLGPREKAALEDDLAGRQQRPVDLVTVLSPADSLPTSAHPEPLLQAVKAGSANLVVLDRTAQVHEAVVAQAAKLHASGTRVRTLSLFYDQWLNKLPVSELEQISLMFDIGELHRARYGRLKRIIDLVIAAAGCALYTRPTTRL